MWCESGGYQRTRVRACNGLLEWSHSLEIMGSVRIANNGREYALEVAAGSRRERRRMCTCIFPYLFGLQVLFPFLPMFRNVVVFPPFFIYSWCAVQIKINPRKTSPKKKHKPNQKNTTLAVGWRMKVGLCVWNCPECLFTDTSFTAKLFLDHPTPLGPHPDAGVCGYSCRHEQPSRLSTRSTLFLRPITRSLSRRSATTPRSGSCICNKVQPARGWR